MEKSVRLFLSLARSWSAGFGLRIRTKILRARAVALGFLAAGPWEHTLMVTVREGTVDHRSAQNLARVGKARREVGHTGSRAESRGICRSPGATGEIVVAV